MLSISCVNKIFLPVKALSYLNTNDKYSESEFEVIIETYDWAELYCKIGYGPKVIPYTV